MNQKPGALDMAQKLRAQPGAGVGALNQAGNVRDYKTEIVRIVGPPSATTPRLGSSVVKG